MILNPSLKIVSAYHGLAQYVSVAKSMPNPDLNKLWLEYAIEPFGQNGLRANSMKPEPGNK
jgi:ABC-type Fe3+ transport system substrate-binding protein